MVWWVQEWRVSPEEGARDLAVMEALLASAAGGGVVVDVTPVPGPSQLSAQSS